MIWRGGIVCVDRLMEIEFMKCTTEELAERILTENFNSKLPLDDINRVYWGVNPAYLYRGLKYYPEYIAALKRSKNVYIDGSSILLFHNLFKAKHEKVPQRSATTDLFPILLKKNYVYGRRIFLLGSTEQNVHKVYEKYRDCNLVGFHHGYFEKNGIENERIIKKINDADTEILFVGFGNPLQEEWILTNLTKISAPVIIPCGGLFDHYSVYKRAPKIIINLGLEWFWRLCQDKFSKTRLKQVKESVMFFITCINAEFQRDKSVRK